MQQDTVTRQKALLKQRLSTLPPCPEERFDGRLIVIAAGGADVFVNPRAPQGLRRLWPAVADRQPLSSRARRSQPGGRRPPPRPRPCLARLSPAGLVALAGGAAGAAHLARYRRGRRQRTRTDGRALPA